MEKISIMVLLALVLVACSKSADDSLEAEQRLAQTKLELEKLKIAEQQRIDAKMEEQKRLEEEQKRLEEERELAAIAAEEERIRQEAYEREEIREAQFELSGGQYIRERMAEECRAQSEYTCSLIEVTSLDYIGSTPSGEYQANFEGEMILENWVEKRQVHFQGVLTHYYEDDEDDAYTRDIEWQNIGERSEAGVGTQLGVLAALWAINSMVNNSN